MNDNIPLEEKKIRQMIGSRVNELRKSFGFTSVELGIKANVSQSQLSKIENGKTAISIPMLTNLCKVLDRPLSYLFQKEEEIPRVLGTLTTVPGPESKALAWFSEKVKELSNDRMSLISLNANVLGSASEQVEMLRQGVIDIFIEELVIYRSFCDAVEAPILPFVFKDDSHFMGYLESIFFKNNFYSSLKKQGVKLINSRWNWRRGLERVLVAKEAIFHPDQIKGKRVRVYDSPALFQFWEELGAEVIIVPWHEVNDAWKNGAFDILPTRKAHLYPMGFCNHGRFVTILDDVPQVLAVVANENKYNSLPPHMQIFLESACDEAGDYFSKFVKEAEVVNENRNMAEYNAIYHKVDLIPWRKAANTIYPRIVKSGIIEPEVWDTLQQFDPVNTGVYQTKQH